MAPSMTHQKDISGDTKSGIWSTLEKCVGEEWAEWWNVFVCPIQPLVGQWAKHNAYFTYKSMEHTNTQYKHTHVYIYTKHIYAHRTSGQDQLLRGNAGMTSNSSLKSWPCLNDETSSLVEWWCFLNRVVYLNLSSRAVAGRHLVDVGTMCLRPKCRNTIK